MADQESMGGAGLAFLLAEFRDIRKGMENRDASLRDSIDGVRTDVKELALSVDRSRTEVDAMRHDVEAVKTDVHSLRADVTSMQKEREGERIRKESSWSGPRRLVQTLVFIAGGGAALFTLAKFWPAISAFLSAL